MKIVESKNKKGNTEFDFVNLESWDDFDTIERLILDDFNFDSIGKIDGIAIRERTFEGNGFKIILKHDDHVGNYAYCVNRKNVQKLRELTSKLIEKLSKIEK